MKRRELLKSIGLMGGGAFFSPLANAFSSLNFFSSQAKNNLLPGNINFKPSGDLLKSAFGKDFIWGVSTAAPQIEGGWNEDGKSPSVWDVFSQIKGKIKTDEKPDMACNFYHKYSEDISLIKQMNFDAFRFSLAWSRILPNGVGEKNQKGIDFYHRVIDKCLEKGIQPWVTLYHWDIPQVLQDKGGWVNRDVINWFGEYVQVCSRAFGDKVKNWMVLNEPLAFTALGYLLGIHAPGKKGFKNFLPAVHHAAMCQAGGGRIIRENVIGSQAGTTFSCSPVEPFSGAQKHLITVEKFDAILNRLFIEPSLGLGYPVKSIKQLKRIDKYVKSGDAEKLKFDFDFIGIQNYTREIEKYHWFIPILKGKPVSAKNKKLEKTEMGWEIYPEGIFKMLKKFSSYDGVKKIYITENGAAFPDVLSNGKVNDKKRIIFFEDYLKKVLLAKNEGVKVEGYFVWSLMDNFEWAEGYRTRFGLVYVDFNTQQRIIKDSGLWFKNFLSE